jgi:hypothetical protein
VFYAACSGGSPDEPPVGDPICANGALTVVCQSDDDCTVQTRCGAGGICAKTCDQFGSNAQCGRCDFICTSLGYCLQDGPGYPTNLLCDAEHPGLAVTIVFPPPGEQFDETDALDIELAGSSVQLAITPQQFSDGQATVVWPWPAGLAAGPGKVSFGGSGPGLTIGCGSATFTADPSSCVSVTIDIVESLDGGLPPGC